MLPLGGQGGLSPPCSQQPDPFLSLCLCASSPPLVIAAMLKVYDVVYNEVDSEDRWIAEMFMVKPSPEDYPEYANIIHKPMDMETIEARIKSGAYSTMPQMVADFDLMFNNALLVCLGGCLFGWFLWFEDPPPNCLHFPTTSSMPSTRGSGRMRSTSRSLCTRPWPS